ncbi:site-specific integrase [Nonomuraea sp. NPDC049625]|uniref:tyrosine-type recombinase/integrase n=1 Tax=Nonomuraea sp. NPDC049625 TaxID=3155775 RepID=UPI003419DA99
MSGDNEHCVVYKRCGCSDGASGRRLGGHCARLTEVWHGSWYFAAQVVGASGRRERVRRGGFASAETARSAGCELLTAQADGPLSAGCTVGQWLRYWLSVMESRLRPTTHRAYRDHVRLHLVPYLGRVKLAELSRRDVTRMFVALGRRRNRYGQPISASTLERIRATLRAALNHAVREDLIAVNPAQGVRLPTPVRTHPVVWTARREAAWRHGGERPTVAVWTVEQLAAFLRFAREDPLFELWWLVALRGLRRGEAAGLRWVDVDLERRELTIAHQLVHTDEGLVLCEPKSAASRRTLALDPETVRLLRRHERVQRRGPGERWSPTSPIFTAGSGAPVQPSYLTHRFHTLVAASGLPPVRLHDLRHGAATLALASGTELKVVQGTLGHASIVLTADTYVSVLPQLYHDSARATARLVLKAVRATNREIGKARETT